MPSYCGYSLESSPKSDSDEYAFFVGEIRNKLVHVLEFKYCLGLRVRMIDCKVLKTHLTND